MFEMMRSNKKGPSAAASLRRIDLNAFFERPVFARNRDYVLAQKVLRKQITLDDAIKEAKKSNPRTIKKGRM